MILAIDHIYTETRRYEESRRFFESLGLRVTTTWGDSGHRACRLESSSAAVVLAEVGPEVTPAGPTVHFALGQAEALAARLAADPAARVLTPLEPTHWGTRWIRVADPEGRVYCLEETARA
jgi:catechol 2,3-dioxygenase-like lactoylglutathione lyase family enzyme